MNITETRSWFARDIRSLCIRNDYYTNGTVKEYEELLEFVDENEPTTENIYQAAYNIVEHSNLERYGQTDRQNIESVMFEIANECYTHFEIQ